MAGFYRYCFEEQLIPVSPAAHVRRPRLDYESNATGLDRNELGMLLVQAGLDGGRDYGLACLLALNGLRISEALNANIEHLGLDGQDVFVTGSGRTIALRIYSEPHNIEQCDYAMDALKRGSARRITAVIPYYGYARQDRKSGPRTPISAKLVANMITTSGILAPLIISSEALGYHPVYLAAAIGVALLIASVGLMIGSFSLMEESERVGSIVAVGSATLIVVFALWDRSWPLVGIACGSSPLLGSSALWAR